jgi:hypothetical protein
MANILWFNASLTFYDLMLNKWSKFYDFMLNKWVHIVVQKASNKLNSTTLSQGHN